MTSEERRRVARMAWRLGYEEWNTVDHARFMATGRKRLVAKLRGEKGPWRHGWDAGWDASEHARLRSERYLRRALAECDPKTRAAIEADAREDGVL